MTSFEIEKLVRSLGIGATYRGYSYLNYGIQLCLKDENYLLAISKSLYPEIAKRFRVTDQKVERAIRNAIEVSWSRGNVETFEKLFGYSIQQGKNRPTNSEYIARIADKMRLDMKSQQK